jgi:formylglycine-generating enzyme required for sulfatase activity
MQGNAWEWCSDGYDADYYKRSLVDDPRGAEGAALRVYRGASWQNGPRRVRPACRDGLAPGDRYCNVGFRLARAEPVSVEKKTATSPVTAADGLRPMDGTRLSGSITNAIGMRFNLIPAGEFMMGSDGTDPDAYDHEFVDKAAGRKEKHRVRITKPFFLSIHEVTRGQFRRFVNDTGYRTEADNDGKGGYGWNEQKGAFEPDPKFTWQNAGFDQTDDHPVVNVSWNDAVAFCQWLSRKEGTTYRLPTEAEWEYACRAGTTTRYFCGDDPEGLAAFGNIADGTVKEKHPNWTTIAARDGYVYTAPVGRYNPNAWGLYDMHGNAWEWCSDGYDADYYKRSPVDDPRGAEGASSRVIRGGSWSNGPRGGRSANRGGNAPGSRSFLSFRLARV